ncbi:hypothetical protein ACWGN5_38450 [Streptomyces sp. NPDC055815]
MTDQGALCPDTHYLLPLRCTQQAGHLGEWHQATCPDSGRILRFAVGAGVRHTQEWEPDGDLDDPEAGQWITWHFTASDSDPTPVVPADLDARVAHVVTGHYPTDQVRTGTSGTEAQCGCGDWYPTLGHAAHVGRELSLLVRSYFDLGLRHHPAHPLPATPEEDGTR